MTDARLAAEAVEALAASTAPQRRLAALAASALAANPSPPRQLVAVAVQVLAMPSTGPTPVDLTDVMAALTVAAYPEALTLGGVTVPDSAAALTLTGYSEALTVSSLDLTDVPATITLNAAPETLSVGMRVADTTAEVALAATPETVTFGPLTLTDQRARLTITAYRESLHIPGEIVAVDDFAATVTLMGYAELVTLTGGDVLVTGWAADESQQAALQFAPDTVAGPITVLPVIVEAPAAVVERPILRVSHVLPALAPDADDRVRSDGTHEVITEEVGVPHLFVSNRDVTYFRGAPVTIGEWSSSLPGGDETAAVDFPQLTPWDVPGTGDLTWLKPDAPAEIYLVKDGARVLSAMFCGHMVSDNAGHSETDLRTGWHLEGTASQADYQGHRVPTMLDPTDIGQLVAKHLNGVVSRRYATVKPVNTGITTRNRGSYSDSEWDYVQALLGVAWTGDGRQWTVTRGTSPRTLKIALKDTSTVHWTLTAGAPGIDVDLTADQSSVVHAIFGRGVGPDGYSWAGWCYPNLRNDDAPAYPYSSAGTVMTIGSTDAGTTSGRGVSDWQERAVQLGYRLSVDGTYSSSDADTCREIQRRYGLLVDGIVGPQTWAATFAVGSNAGSLDGAYRRPLAIVSAVDPNLYAADGGIVGTNPAYDPGIIRRELDIDYGTGVTKAEATTSAQQQLVRDSTPGWAGTITCKTDPHEGSRFEVFEGQNIKLLGFRGGDPLLQVVEARKGIDEDLTATFTVDSKARDAMTLSSILGRDRDSKADPARRPGNVNRRSRQEQDMVVEFDGESGAGVIPRHALYSGLWTVIRIPVSQVGRVAKIDITTTGPHAKFALALFGAPIQPTHLVRYVGNPLGSDDPFGTHADTLVDKFGFIEGWGQSGQAAGYYPGSEGSGSLTGRLLDTGGLEYVSQKSPWVWVAEYATSSCFISGRIYPAPVV